jgi:hypothetical protein
MLTKQDLKSISVLLKVQKTELVEELVEDLDTRFNKKLELRLAEQTKEILKGIAQYIQENLIPLFDDHETRIKHLEKHTNHPPVVI